MSRPDALGGEGAAAPVRFLVDDHLKRLARWLRCAGVDAVWEPEIADRELYRRSWVEKRTILTMKKSMWAPRLFHIESRAVREQFRAVTLKFGIDPYERAFSRCVVCNVPLEVAPKEEVAADVPPKAWSRFDLFKRCPECRRVFWRGSHTKRTLEFFEQATGRKPPESRFSNEVVGEGRPGEGEP